MDLSAKNNAQTYEIDVVRRAELEIVGRASPAQALFGGEINFDHIVRVE